MRQITYRIILLFAIVAVLLSTEISAYAAAAWTSPNHYRLLLNVDTRGVVRRNSPASVDVNLQQSLINQGSTGTLDDDTIEVIGYNAAGQPATFDASRTGYEKHLLPCRVDKYYPVATITLNFVIPNETYTQYYAYFDTKESGLGKPMRYKGIVGDGDKFTDGYQRREIIANVHDTFADLDRDGDLDLFKGGVEPYIYCYENVGGNKFVDRGKLTSGGSVITFPYENGNHRSWTKVEFADWDNDGDLDLFVNFGAPTVSPDNYFLHVVRYENTTIPGGPLTFVNRGKLLQGSKSLNGNITIVDWNGDGKKDVLVDDDGMVTFFKNIGTDSSPVLGAGEYIKANGENIQLYRMKIDCADIDTDGDLDLFMTMCDGKVFWFKNVGTRTNPVFMEGKCIVFFEGGYSDLNSGIKIADWDNDGLLDFVAGCFWQRTHWGEQPRMYGRLYKNVGTLTNPVFEAKDAYNGCPYTETFQQCDALRQNGVRCVDWNNDGKKDLIASDTDGFVWFFRNTTNHLFPVFATGERLMAGDGYVKVQGEEERRMRDGYARTDICDWNNDGKLDLLVADGGGWIWLYKSTDTDDDGEPILGAGTRIEANDNPIDSTARSSVLVCDWNNDGKKDIIQGVTGQDNVSEFWDWELQFTGDTNQSNDSGYLFFKNIGSDTDPQLDKPTWVRAGDPVNGTIITYNSRPNLGSFVDWDGDGKNDFITGEFESSSRFYKNTGTGLPGTLPVFANTDGIHIVQPWTVQMMSGADAVNFNDDTHPNRPEYDIITGQGHGATGLRFYERDYIVDFLGNTFPTVSIGATSQAYAIVDAKALGNNLQVIIPGAVVTANLANCFYIGSENNESGIRVVGQASGVAVGGKVDVSGNMTVNSHGERFINTTTPPVPNGSGNAKAVYMTNKALGGADLVIGTGQIGITEGKGANNIGLLVQTSGKCTANLAITGADYSGKKYIFIDDGSGSISWYRTAVNTYQQVNGVKVEVDDASITVGSFVTARGASSIELVNGVHIPRILPRAGMGDVVKF